MTHSEFSFNIYKTTFHGQTWTVNNTKAVVVLVHGMGEHATRYTDSVIPKLVENEFSVVAFDHFGHGKTNGKRGHNPGFDAVLESVTKTIEKAKDLFPEKSIFLYGHSMGGNVIINYALRNNNTLKGFIATSPFLKLAFEPPKVKLIAGKLLQKIAPFVTMGNELDVNDISRDKKEVEKYINDPLIHHKISPNFSITFIETGKWAIENAYKLRKPMLILHGKNDKITDFKGSLDFKNKTNYASIKLYDGGYHELHNDLCKEEMLDDVVNWLNNQL